MTNVQIDDSEKKMSAKTFMVMAGGTGGHIFPALAVAQALQQQGHHIVWLGSEGWSNWLWRFCDISRWYSGKNEWFTFGCA